ncbi:MAG: MFS transporter [Oscillospiraceae bacterium]|nr:MFS transporter [Oscillospiraceae bacterium]
MKLFSEYRGLRKEMYILFIGRVMTNLGSMIWPMFTLILNRKLGLNAGTIATCMMVFSIVSLPISLLGGKLADKLNKKNIIVVCDLISIGAYIYCFLVPVSIRSIAVFACASLFQTVEWPSYDALVADFTTSANRERAYSLQYLGANLGLVLAPTLGGLLFNNYLNLAFLINGIAIGFSTLLIYLMIKDVHREEDSSEQAAYEQEIDSNASALSYVLHNRVLTLMIAISALGGTIYGMYNYLMPLDLTQVHGSSGSVIFGTITSVNCIIVVAFTALITRVFRRIRDAEKMLTGQVLELLGFVIFVALVRSTLMCYVAIIVFTFGEIFNTLASSPFLTRRIPASHRGRIMAVSNVFGSLVGSGLQMGVGFIYDGFGSFTAWLTIFGMGAVNLILLSLMRHFDRADYPALYQ